MYLGFEIDEDDQYLDDAQFDKPKKKLYEVDFKVYSEEQIRTMQQQQFEEVSNILGLPIEQCATLLRQYKWQKEKLIEQFMDHPDEVTKSAGILTGDTTQPQLQTVRNFVCDVCFEDSPSLKTFALHCGHRFCAACYGQYLTQKIKEEGESVRIQCMAEECNVTMNGRAVSLLVDQKTHARSV